MSVVKITNIDEHNAACDRISELRQLDPDGTNPEVIAEAMLIADDILNFWRGIGIDESTERDGI